MAVKLIILLLIAIEINLNLFASRFDQGLWFYLGLPFQGVFSGRA